MFVCEGGMKGLENLILYHGIGYELSMSGLTQASIYNFEQLYVVFSLGACW